MPNPYRESDNTPPAPLKELAWRRRTLGVVRGRSCCWSAKSVVCGTLDAQGKWDNPTPMNPPASSSPSPRARVGHSGYWNADRAFRTACIRGTLKDSSGVCGGAHLDLTGPDFIHSVDSSGADGSFCLVGPQGQSGTLSGRGPPVSFPRQAGDCSVPSSCTDVGTLHISHSQCQSAGGVTDAGGGVTDAGAGGGPGVDAGDGGVTSFGCRIGNLDAGTMIGGPAECYEYKDVPLSNLANTEAQKCTDLGYKHVVGSCPTGGLLGCCSRPSSAEECFYNAAWWCYDVDGGLNGCVASLKGQCSWAGDAGAGVWSAIP